MRHAGPVGAEELDRLRRGHRVLVRHLPRAAGLLACGPGTTCATAQDEFDIVHDNQCLGYGLLAHRARWACRCSATIHHPITVDRRLEMEHAESWYKRLTLRRWYAFTDMQTRGGPPAASGSSRCRRTPSTTSSPTTRSTRERMARRARRRRPRPVPPAARASSAVPGRLITTAVGRRRHEGPAGTCSRRWPSSAPSATTSTSSSSASASRAAPVDAHHRASSASSDHVEFVTGVPDERIIELYSEAELAVVPSLYEGFSLPAIEAMSLRRRRWWPPPAAPSPRSSATTARPPCSCRPATARRWPPSIALGARRARPAGTHRRRRPPAGHRPAGRWRHTAEKTVEQYRVRLAEHARAARLTPMLTVDYDRLGLQPATCCSTWAAAPAATPSRRFRRGARVVAFDYDAAELKDVAGLFAAMREAGEAPAERGRGRRRQRRRHPPAVPRRHLRPDHRRRGARAHPRRRGRRSTSSSGCSSPAARSPSPSRRGCPSRSAGRCPTSTTPRSSRAATCASTPRPSCGAKLRGAGLEPGGAHHAHALHSPVLVAEVRGRAHQRRPPAGAGLPPGPRLGHRADAAHGTLTRLDRAGRSTRCSARASWSTPASPVAEPAEACHDRIDVAGLVSADRAARHRRRASPSGSCPSG